MHWSDMSAGLSSNQKLELVISELTGTQVFANSDYLECKVNQYI